MFSGQVSSAANDLLTIESECSYAATKFLIPIITDALHTKSRCRVYKEYEERGISTSAVARVKMPLWNGHWTHMEITTCKSIEEIRIGWVGVRSAGVPSTISDMARPNPLLWIHSGPCEAVSQVKRDRLRAMRKQKRSCLACVIHRWPLQSCTIVPCCGMPLLHAAAPIKLSCPPSFATPLMVPRQLVGTSNAEFFSFISKWAEHSTSVTAWMPSILQRTSLSALS